MRVITLALLSLAALLPGGVVIAQEVGVTAAVDQSAIGTPPADKPHTLSLGDKVIHNEAIETDAKGLLQILLADGTSFTVGPNSKMSIDSFVYDPDAGTAKVTATLSKGLFRFIGGKTSKADGGVKLNTPVGTVGIRGGIADIDLGGHGTTSHIDMRFGDSVTLTDGGKQLGWIFQNGYSIVIGDAGGVSIEKTPPAWTSAMQGYLSSHGGQNGGAKGTTNGSTLVAHGNQQNGNGTNNTPDGVAPPDPLSPNTVKLATWEEINNSSMANVYAKYFGTAVGSITDEGGTSEADGKFALKYSFGRQKGYLSIWDFGNLDSVHGKVEADSDTGVASFHGDNLSSCHYGCEEGGLSGSVAGAFIDQNNQTASGVIGDFTIEGDGVTATGALAGTLKSTHSGETD